MKTSLHLDILNTSVNKVLSARMHLKNPTITRHLAWALLAVSPLCNLLAQPPAPPAPAEAAPANELEALFTDAEKGFAAKDYKTAVTKLETLLKAIAANPGVPPATLELVRFNIGLAYLLDNDGPKAEAAFTECLVKHPKGEYTSRAYLGVGRACMLQGTEKPEKKEKAIEALKVAAADPKYRSEAGLSLGQLYNETNRPDEAFKVFRTLMGSDIRTPAQTNAAVEVIGILADSEKLGDLTAYLDRVINQSGVRDSIAWYSNQIIVRGDTLSGDSKYEAALALYRSIPSRRQILEIQRVSLEEQKKEVAALEKRVAEEAKLPIARRSTAGELLGNAKAALEVNTQALTAIESKADLDAALLIRRGRCLFYMDRFEEALVCFRTIRDKFPESPDLESAAYSEIFVYNQLQNTDELSKRASDFLAKHPNSKNLEQVAILAGEGLAKAGKWEEVLTFYKGLETKFPSSASLDRFVFLQGVALFRLGKFSEAGPVFSKFITTFPNSELYEDGLYQVAIANFVEGKYKETLKACNDYLQRYPTGRYAGDIFYRLCYIDYRDEDKDQSENLIKKINERAAAFIDDPATGMLLNLLGDVYTLKKPKPGQKDPVQSKPDALDKGLDAYKRAAFSESPDDVIRYAAEQATNLLQQKKDWAGLAELHSTLMKRYPGTQLALQSTEWVVKMMVREGKGAEAAALLSETLKENIADPANEQVESLLDEVVRTLVPKRVRGQEPDADKIFAELNSLLDKAASGQENPTTNARKVYAGARLFDMLRLPDRANLLLKGLAANADPTTLSPLLLSACGEILIEENNLEAAEAMFQRIVDRFPESPFSDAGPVGLGRVAMAKKDWQKALDTFTNALETAPGNSKFREATVGKLEALTKLGKLDDAEKLGLEILGDKSFKGEASGQAYLALGEVFRARAATASGSDKEESLRKANGYFQNAFARFKAIPEIAAEGLLRSHETLIELGESAAADEVLVILKGPKFEKTKAGKKAQTL